MFANFKAAKVQEALNKPLSQIFAEFGFRVVVLPTAQAKYLMTEVVPDAKSYDHPRVGKDLLDSLDQQLGDLTHG